MLPILICAALYAIKGGQLDRIAAVKKLRGKNGVLGRILHGRILSSIGFGLLVGVYSSELIGPAVYAFPSVLALVAGLAWLAGVAPKMGRIVGDIGGYRGNWDGNHKQGDRARAVEGWKAGLQRGIYMGGLLALATDSTWFIVAGALYPVTIWIGVSIEQFRTKSYAANWHWHEVLFGSVLGLAFSLTLF